jgi:hypothetical protein
MTMKRTTRLNSTKKMMKTKWRIPIKGCCIELNIKKLLCNTLYFFFIFVVVVGLMLVIVGFKMFGVIDVVYLC